MRRSASSTSAPHEKGERFEELPMDKFAEHTRAFVKVEDGCNRRCAYCVIPRARGPVRSRDEASVLEELRRLADAGYKEVVLTAISLPSYGTDSGTSLVELIEKKPPRCPALSASGWAALTPTCCTMTTFAAWQP